MPRQGTGPDFIEALARGLDVITAFEPRRPVMSLAQVAEATGLARPTARRILLTLRELGYVRVEDGGYALTPRVLDLGVSYVRSMGLWDVARPHMERLVERTNESCSIAQLDGSDIVYVARVSVPKIVALAVQIGTRFPALQTSLGKVQLAALDPEEVDRILAEPSRSGLEPRVHLSKEERDAELREVRARGVGDDRRAARARHPLGGGAAAGRLGPGHRGHQRQHPCGRDARRAARGGVPAAAAAHGGGDQRGLRAAGDRPARHPAGRGVRTIRPSAVPSAWRRHAAAASSRGTASCATASRPAAASPATNATASARCHGVSSLLV